MVATITLACLALCPSSTVNVDHQTINEEWRTHTAPVLSTFKSPHRGMGDDVDQWLPLVAGHFGDLGPDAIQTVLCLMSFESGGNPSARNPRSSATGLMQILASTWGPKYGFTRTELESPEINLWVARQLYDDGGWNHWAPYQRGECR